MKSPVEESPTNTASVFFSGKDASPFKEIMQTLEKPPRDSTSDFPSKKIRNWQCNSPPRSADYYSAGKNRSSFFFQNLAAVRKSHNFRMPRSASMRTPSPPPASKATSPPPPTPNRPTLSSSTPGSFQALTKIRKSLRDKKSASSAGIVSTTSNQPRSPSADSQAQKYVTKGSMVHEDADLIAALRDENSASKDAIEVLRKQVEELQKEKETL